MGWPCQSHQRKPGRRGAVVPARTKAHQHDVTALKEMVHHRVRLPLRVLNSEAHAA
jgi:predicted transcriptional regulator